MADTTKLVQATIKYKQKRAEIKARQRQELEQELEAWKADVGDEISDVRRRGLSVADVCNAIGNQNRTFVYDMIGASARRRGVAKPEVTGRDDHVHPDNDDDIWLLTFLDNVAVVEFPEDERYDIIIIDGVPDLPEEWADHTKDRRDLYKQIIKAINEHDWA